MLIKGSYLSKNRLLLSYFLFLLLIYSFIGSIYYNKQISAKFSDYPINDFFLDSNSYKGNDIELISNRTLLSNANPTISLDNFNIPNIVWSEQNRILFKYYNRFDGWIGKINVTDEIFSDNIWYANTSMIIDSSGNIHVTFEATTDIGFSGPDKDIFYTYYDPIENVWTGKTNEYFDIISTESSNESSNPKICLDQNENPCICWSELNNESRDIVFKYYDSNTFQWRGYINQTDVITDESISYDTFYSSIACDSSSAIHIVYSDISEICDSNLDEDIFYKYYNSTLQQWIGKINQTDLISSDSTSTSKKPSIAVNGDFIHILWYDQTDIHNNSNFNNLFYKYWNGKEWTGRINSTDIISINCYIDEKEASIAIDSKGFIHFCWTNIIIESSYFLTNILHRYWDSNVNKYSSVFIVSDDTNFVSLNPNMVVQPHGTVFICWLGTFDFNLPYTNFGVFYRNLVFYLEKPKIISVSYNEMIPGMVLLDWDDVFGATKYYIYQCSNCPPYWMQREELEFITVVDESFYQFNIFKNDIFLRIISSNDFINSSTYTKIDIRTNFILFYVGMAFTGSLMIGITIATIVILRKNTIK